MDRKQLDEIVACLPSGRTLFYYFKDRYALLILEHVLGQGRTVSDLKASAYAPLMAKPIVRRLLGNLGRGRIRASDLQAPWPDGALAYRLTLGHWPMDEKKWQRGWHQMIRRGQNLVLQLNFSVSHNRRMQQMLKADQQPEQWDFHPVAGGREVTLAWARLDLDLDSGEALIEEVQSDWVSDALANSRMASRDEYYLPCVQYVDGLLKPHLRLWDEAMLAAAVWFLRSQIGLGRIFYYTFDTGNRLKRIQWRKPPRSLYTDLPRRFCFRLTHNGPLFLRNMRDRFVRRNFSKPQTQWFRLDL